MKKFMAGILVGLLLVTALGAVHVGRGTGTYDVEVIGDELIVIMDTRTSEIKVMTPVDCMPFSVDNYFGSEERTIKHYKTRR